MQCGGKIALISNANLCWMLNPATTDRHHASPPRLNDPQPLMNEPPPMCGSFVGVSVTHVCLCVCMCELTPAKQRNLQEHFCRFFFSGEFGEEKDAQQLAKWGNIWHDKQM